MRRLILGVFLLVACAEPDNVGDAGGGGTTGSAGTGGGAGGDVGGQAGTLVPACGSTPTGSALLVAGSTRATAPDAEPLGFEGAGLKCSDWVASHPTMPNAVAITAGAAAAPFTAEMTSSAPIDTACGYTFRVSYPPGPLPARPCAETGDYSLIIDS